MIKPPDNRKPVTIDYTNYKGERALRRILPIRMDFGWNQWHKQTQYYIVGIDLEKEDEIRTFAIKNIHSWVEEGDEAQRGIDSSDKRD